MLKIAIQGVRASFHDVAARQFFANTDIQPIECATFRLLCEKLANGEADYAMMAIENTIAGSILTNYVLLEEHGFKIIGETYLRIEMCFLALPGQSMADIRYVQSHPMALLQCQEFISGLGNIQVIEAADTAESALAIKTQNLSHYAAIASQLAADTYGLEVLQSNIETDHANFTRFLVLTRHQVYHQAPDANKSSIRFEAAHKPGSLAAILSDLSENQVNMTKIQSVPIIGKPYQYSFHVDLEWADPACYHNAMTRMRQDTLNFIHFGDYHSGEKFFL